MRQPLVVLAVVTACTSAGRGGVPPTAPVSPGPGSAVVGSPRAQPPEVKLRLGHYVSDARGLGVTIDRTSELSGRRVAKLRYDGTADIVLLEAQPGSAHRTDYLAHRKVVLHVYETGRVEIYVGDEGPIALRRDRDAAPL